MKLEDLVSQKVPIDPSESLTYAPDYVPELNNEFKSAGVFTREFDINQVTPSFDEVVESLCDQPHLLFNHPNYKGSNLEKHINSLIDMKTDIQVETETSIPDYLLYDPEVVGYPDIEMQNEIYSWALNGLEIGKYNVIDTVKDLGAGRGDFFKFMDGNVEYTGFEKKPGIVMAGIQKYDEIRLINEDYFDHDLHTTYTFCIGTLNEDHGFDKWEYFNKTLNYALKSTEIAIIFILASDMEGIDGYLDYPIDELVSKLPKHLKYNIDYTKFKDIYKLTVNIDSF